MKREMPELSQDIEGLSNSNRKRIKTDPQSSPSQAEITQQETPVSFESQPIDFAKVKIYPPIKISYLFYEILPDEFYDSYKYIEEIGSGACGYVYKALHYPTNSIRAIKKIELNPNQDFKEIEILKQAKHPNIVTPIEYTKDNTHLYIVTEFCEGGSLFDKILKQGRFSEAQCRTLVKQILSGLAYCHEKKIVHRDIKPENLLFESPKEDSQIKIIDFGVSTNFNSDYLYQKCGSAYYVAPEILKGGYNEKCDIWSLGVVFYIMMTGQPLVDGRNQMEILRKIAELQQIDTGYLNGIISSQGKNVIEQMLTVDFRDRPSAKLLLDHPWFSQSETKMSDPDHSIALSKALKGLRNFVSHNYLQNLIYFYTTSCIMHREERSRLSMIFAELDKDHDGRLKFDELVQAFVKSGRTFERSYQLVYQVLDQLQLPESEGIEYSHFLVICCNKQDVMNESALTNAFKIWDAEGKGFIDTQAIKEVLKKGYFAEDPEIAKVGEAFMQQLHLDGGSISFEDFKRLMNKFVEDEQMSQSLTFNMKS